ncbi:hypothetical protein Fcan01_07924 [Folsomia candida]|uniref:Uncharacterized protein n=1 Tax=Folsomia candida TaxID=158441 RepID=A0A226EJV7_FOLCA|nr:hypothetical protein Fcan01_07924 [Folsomia candida]
MKSCYSRAKLKVTSLYKEPPASKLNVRHAKCLQPASDSSPLRQLNGVDKWKQQTTKENYLESPKTKFAPLVQIRSLPLCLSQLRSSTRPMIKGHGENTLQRSSYVVNTKNEKVQVKRARSLSPVILRTTAVEPLTSPNLVRSSSFPKKNGRKRFLGSFIPIRSTYTSISRECRHQRQRTPTPTPAVLSSSPVPNPATSKCQRPPPSLSPRHRVFDGSSTSCGVVVEGKVKIVAITNKSPGVRNHQEKVPVQPTEQRKWKKDFLAAPKKRKLKLIDNLVGTAVFIQHFSPISSTDRRTIGKSVDCKSLQEKRKLTQVS